MKRARARSGQAVVEYAVLYAGVILPLTFMIVFVSEMLWVWHSAVDWTRDGARYAATHCWTADAGNVLQYMRTHVPRTIDMDRFANGTAEIRVEYFARPPEGGALVAFTCEAAECSAGCVPDAVSVSVANYQFLRFSSFFKLPPVTMPPFTTSLPVESAGCDEAGTCSP
jgi:hypothetical protein